MRVGTWIGALLAILHLLFRVEWLKCLHYLARALKMGYYRGDDLKANQQEPNYIDRP